MLHIPDEQLPAEFKDEERLNSLFSPFRSGSVNPKDYDTKIASWKQIIALYCTANGVYSFSLSQLNALFVRNGRPPSCLGAVVEDLVRNNELQPLALFLQTNPNSWTGWIGNVLVKKTMSWSFGKMKSLVSSGINPNESYVHLNVVKSESYKLLTIIPEKFKGKVMSYEDFVNFSAVSDRQKDFKLLLHCLENEKQVDIKLVQPDKNAVILLKFAQANKLEPITETDIGIYALEQNEKLFMRHVEDMEDEINGCVKECKQHLLKNHKQLAKSCLRKKHEIQKRLDKKISALQNIQVLLEKIKDTHMDASVWQSYKHALNAFSATFKRTGLTEDGVEDTMVKLGEVLDIHDDIQAAMSRPIQEDTDDLEKELEELMSSNDAPNEPPPEDTDNIDKKLAHLNLDDLPEVPTTEVLTQVPLQ